MTYPQRKPLRLKEYDYSLNNAYFVTICVYGHVPLFGEIENGTLKGSENAPHEMVERRLLDTEHHFETVTVDSYVIMPNHIHFILINSAAPQRRAETTLPKIIAWFKAMTTNEYIKGVRSGLYKPFERHLWQRSYYEHVIRQNDDLQRIREYIEQNPEKWADDKLWVEP